MLKKQTLFAVAAGLALAATSQAADAASKIKIGFLPGVVDPFYQVMQVGVETAAKALGIEVVTQIPPTWGVEAQTPLLNAISPAATSTTSLPRRPTRNRWWRPSRRRLTPASR